MNESPFNTIKQGGLKRVALILVAVLVVGLGVWWIATTVKAQQDAKQKAADIEVQVKPKTAYVSLDVLGLRYKSSDSAGQVSYDVTTIGDVKTVPLISSRLKLAEYSCAGENTGEFGYLLEVTPAAFGIEPTYKKVVGGKTYGLVSTTRKECFNEELVKQFGETVPKAIVESLEPISQ